MDKNCHIPDLVQAFSNVENGGLNLISFIQNNRNTEMQNTHRNEL